MGEQGTQDVFSRREEGALWHPELAPRTGGEDLVPLSYLNTLPQKFPLMGSRPGSCDSLHTPVSLPNSGGSRWPYDLPSQRSKCCCFCGWFDDLLIRTQ